MHYLEDVFGVVDPQAAQADVDFEQKEWELDQLEKLKVRRALFQKIVLLLRKCS